MAGEAILYKIIQKEMGSVPQITNDAGVSNSTD